LDRNTYILAALFLVASASLMLNGYGFLRLGEVESHLVKLQTQNTQTFQTVSLQSTRIGNLSDDMLSLKSQVGESAQLALSQAKKETYDTYMNFGGIQGEATESVHRDWIGVLSMSWGMHKTGTMSSSQEMKILKAVDKSSPKLYEALQQGTNLDTVQIELMEQATGKIFLTYTLKNVIISSVNTGPIILKDWDVSSPKLLISSRPIEEVSFSFQKITMTYSSTLSTTMDKVVWEWDTSK
jgi:type VI secretion system Hcp family effector